MEEEERREYLPLHPPDHPHAIFRCPVFAALTESQVQRSIISVGRPPCVVELREDNARHEVKLRVDRPEHDDIQIVSEIGPSTHEDHEACDLGAIEL